MSAKRRNRKNQRKRSKSDVDSYTERYRKASDAAKAARAAARGRAEGPRGLEVAEAIQSGFSEGFAEGVRIVEEARLRGVSLVSQEHALPGYFLEVGGFEDERQLVSEVLGGARGLEPDTEYVVRANGGEPQTIRTEAAPDAEALVERSAPSSEGLPPAEQVAESQGRAAAEARTFFEEVDDVRELADAANGPLEVLAAVIEAKERAEAEYARRHYVFFEAEVNGLPTHVGGCQCYCELGANHWKELGEI